MGGVIYEVTDEDFVTEAGGNGFKFVVKHGGVVLPGLLFDHDPDLSCATPLQLVGLDSMGGPTPNSKHFRSRHRGRAKAQAPNKKKRTVKTAKSELASEKPAGDSAVSPD